MSTSKNTYKDLVDLLLHRFPLNYQEEWDESGLKDFGGLDLPLDSVIVCLDVTKKVIETAITNKSHLIISHHPIFTNNPDITPTKVDQDNLALLKANMISLLSLHTCVDNNPLGLNHYLISMLDVKNVKQVKCTEGTYYTAELFVPTRLKMVMDQLNRKFQTYKLIYREHNENPLIKKINLCSGSGFDVFKEKLTSAQVDELFITGDIKWHDWVYINQLGINVIDIGHDLEKYFVNMATSIILHTYPNLNVIEIYPDINLRTISL